jgi:ABC-type uncharacterized transport system permease subunit
MLEAVLTGAVAGGTCIVFAGLGEIVAERSGVINLGTEGSMLCGALAAYAVGIETGNPWLGVLAGLLAGALLASVHALLVLHRGANQIAVGLVVSFLGIGITALFGQDYVGQGVVPLETWDVPLLSKLPFLGPVLFQHDPLTYVSFLAVPALSWVLWRTRAKVPRCSRSTAPPPGASGGWPSSSAVPWRGSAAPSWPPPPPSTGPSR